jgi:hypothetical protein
VPRWWVQRALVRNKPNSPSNHIQLTYSSGVLLKCGLHKCTSSCHQLFDHSKIRCEFVLTQKCSNGHSQSWICHTGAPPVCRKCENARKQAAKKAQKDLEEKLKRDEKDEKHRKELAKIDEEIAKMTLGMKNLRVDNEQQAVLAQKRRDLEAAKEQLANKAQNLSKGDPLDIDDNKDPAPRNGAAKKLPQMAAPPAAKVTPHRHSNVREYIKTAVEHNKSPSKTEWQRQKDQENAKNPAIDKIMEMIGLEEVKSQVLRIKAKVETSIRQGTDIKKERLGLVLLGNPGTGIASSVHSSNEVV